MNAFTGVGEPHTGPEDGLRRSGHLPHVASPRSKNLPSLGVKGTRKSGTQGAQPGKEYAAFLKFTEEADTLLERDVLLGR